MSELSSTIQPPSGPGADEHVRHDRLHRRRAEGEAGLRIEPADFRDHVGEIFVGDGANLLQGGEIALGQQIETPDQGGHRRIEAVALLELQGQALGEIARADARRIEALQDAEHRLDLVHSGAEFFRRGFKIAAEVAGLVDEIDEILADHPLRRVG